MQAHHHRVLTMTFRTVLSPPRSEVSISHTDRLLCIGSCFAEQMGGRLQRLKFPTLVNPFGIVFNPVSIGKMLGRLMHGRPFVEADLWENQGLWHSFEHHGRFSQPDKTAALVAINNSFSTAKAFLKNTNRLLVTLGTANVFVLRETGEVVANCHKFPASGFERRRLTVAETVQALQPIFELMRRGQPRLEIIVTVSPVRHLRDGLVENQRSKATLLLALEAICDALPFVHYFPSYEILLDDLRDYRFYADDMAHPSTLATEYIWRHFEAAFFDDGTKALCGRIGQVLTALAHRPLHPQSLEHQSFLSKQRAELSKLMAAHPSLDFESELGQLDL